MLHLHSVLNPDELAQARAALQAADWEDGRVTSRSLPASINSNRQLPQQGAVAQRLQQMVLQALRRNQLFFSAALPRRIAPPMFNRYEGQHGDYLDDHVDVALRFLPCGERVRTDMSCTLFLSDPQEYEGGELVLQDTWRDEAIKLAAGDLLLYTGDRIHRVNPVTRGCRLACFFWLESMVRRDEQRRLLFQMARDLVRLRAEAQGAPSPAVLGLTGRITTCCACGRRSEICLKSKNVKFQAIEIFVSYKNIVRV